MIQLGQMYGLVASCLYTRKPIVLSKQANGVYWFSKICMNCVASHPYIARPRITQPRTALVQSVVRVRAFDAFRPWSRSHGSGFLWDHNGHIVSCQLYSGLVFRKHISKTGSSRNNL